MNKEQKKFKKVIARRKRHTRRLQKKNEARIKFRSMLQLRKREFVAEHKKRAEMNKENNAKHRKQLCKLLNISEHAARKFTTDALEALYDAKLAEENTND